MISDNWSNEVEQMSIVKARAMLTKLPEQLSESNQAVALTRRGTPVLAVMGWDLFESIVETLEIIGDPELMAILRRDINRVQEEGLVPVEQLLAKINEEEALAGGE